MAKASSVFDPLVRSILALAHADIGRVFSAVFSRERIDSSASKKENKWVDRLSQENAQENAQF